MKNRVFIFGIDGASHEMLNDFMARGIMPNLARTLRGQRFWRIDSSIPDLSCIAWSSIITGADPGEHGILGFMELIPGTYSLSFPNFRNLKRAPYWESEGGKSIVINVPTTYPARETDGVLVSGFVALDLDAAVYPPELLDELKATDYQVDVDTTKAHVSMDLFLQDLNFTLDKRRELLRTMLERHPDWENFMYVITGTDRLGHFLHVAYEDEDHPHHADFIDFYRRVDEVLGDVLGALREDDSLLLVSDHGFETITSNVYPNALLRDQGLLRLRPDKRIKYTSIEEGTKAFVLDPGRVFVNEKGKYPNGSVDPADRETVLRELEELFTSWEHEGTKVIDRVYRREEIYTGPETDRAADLVLMAAPGYSLRGTLSSEVQFDNDIFTGKHRFDNGIFGLATPNGQVVPEPRSVRDVRQVMNAIRKGGET